MNFADIVEVIETGQRGANVLLKHGYSILAVDQVAKLKAGRAAKEAKLTTYVRKDMLYVLGRTKQVPSYKLTEADFL